LEADTVRALCHDMRQPLMALRLLASDLEQPAHREVLVAVRHEVDWLAALVESVLGPASSDSPAETDFGALVAHAAAVAFAGSPCRHVVTPLERVWVQARGSSLERAVLCLLDNAIRAAGPQGTVELTLAQRGGHAVLTVADDGPGVGHIPSQHSLGLPTVRAVMADCGGGFSLGERAGGGALAVLQVPLLSAALAS
jgi:signal transduction histidine kinase